MEYPISKELMIKNNKLKYCRRNRTLQFISLVALCCINASCNKDSLSIVENSKAKRTVVDYVLDLESLYLIKYQFQYNDSNQVTNIYRGERFANTSQLQLIAKAFYSTADPDKLPDSLVTYNTKGFRAGVIYANSYNKVAVVNSERAYVWPERINKLLLTPGGRLALAISGAKINWAGDGHLGSAGEIKIMDNLLMINRGSLKDSIQIPVPYKTDGSNRKVNDFMIKYNKFGYPIDISFYDLNNAGFERAKINYREE